MTKYGGMVFDNDYFYFRSQYILLILLNFYFYTMVQLAPGILLY